MLFSNLLGNILFFITGMAAAFRPLLFGGMAQLGARLNGIQEARGSSPLISIAKMFLKNASFAKRFFMILYQ